MGLEVASGAIFEERPGVYVTQTKKRHGRLCLTSLLLRLTLLELFGEVPRLQWCSAAAKLQVSGPSIQPGQGPPMDGLSGAVCRGPPELRSSSLLVRVWCVLLAWIDGGCGMPVGGLFWGETAR
jgi:hypothetical protein